MNFSIGLGDNYPLGVSIGSRNPDIHIQGDFDLEFEIRSGITFKKNPRENFGTIETETTNGELIEILVIEIDITSLSDGNQFYIGLARDESLGQIHYSLAGNGLDLSTFKKLIGKLYDENITTKESGEIRNQIANIL